MQCNCKLSDKIYLISSIGEGEVNFVISNSEGFVLDVSLNVTLSPLFNLFKSSKMIIKKIEINHIFHENFGRFKKKIWKIF